MRFRDRQEAGWRLARALAHLQREHPVVVGLPRGGVPVAAEVARELHAPLDVLVVRKLGHPRQPELGVGAIAEDGVSIVDWEMADRLGIDPATMHRVAARERAELDRRIVRYRKVRPRIPLEGRAVILVDDGLATGSTARVAIAALRRAGARQVILAVPVAPLDAVEEMRGLADAVVCLSTPSGFGAVGEWYDDFGEVTDEDVTRLLHEGAEDPPVVASAGHQEVAVDTAGARLAGTLEVPDLAAGLVLFAHGSGSSRLSPRNREVAATLNRAGIATLLFDLLTDDEAGERGKVFDIELLGGRLVDATRWCRSLLGSALPIGYFGASTGAAAALVAAARLGRDVSAVVSRGGRPDLADIHLPLVSAPTLLVVGSRDPTVLDLNRQAAARLVHCEHRLVVVPGASHLFEEAGTLEAVATLATEWFTTHFAELDARSGHVSA